VKSSFTGSRWSWARDGIAYAIGTPISARPEPGHRRVVRPARITAG
jgi:hypothetical protein